MVLSLWTNLRVIACNLWWADPVRTTEDNSKLQTVHVGKETSNQCRWLSKLMNLSKRRVTPDCHYSIRPQCSGTLTLHAVCPPYRWKWTGRSWQTSGKANPKWHPARFCTCQSSAVMALSGLTSFRQKSRCLSLQQTDVRQLCTDCWPFEKWHWAITLHKLS